MVGPVGPQSNQQIPAANTFRPGGNAAEQVLNQKDKFDTAPKDNVERLQSRNTERQEYSQEAKKVDVSASSLRGSSLDISV